MTKELDLLKYGYVLIHKDKAYSVMYNILDNTKHDQSKWTEEQKELCKNFTVMLVIKVWPHAVKNELLGTLPTGQVYVLGFKGHETLPECKSWALDQWNNREATDWWEETKEAFNKVLKDRFIKKGILQ